MKANDNETLTIAGKNVVVRYARTQEEACASCAFCSRKECHDLDCNMRDIIDEGVCRYAYFVEAERQVSADVQEAAKPTCKTCRHYENDCPQIRGKFIPYPSRVCKDYSDTTAQAQPAPASTIKGWVARDENGQVWLYAQRPFRNHTVWTTDKGRYFIRINDTFFPDLRWEDEPIEVEIIIKPKH